MTKFAAGGFIVLAVFVDASMALEIFFSNVQSTEQEVLWKGILMHLGCYWQPRANSTSSFKVIQSLKMCARFLC